MEKALKGFGTKNQKGRGNLGLQKDEGKKEKKVRKRK